ncbi:hypothetical protein [Microbacterium lacticum]
MTGGDVHVGAAEGGELDGDDHVAGGQQDPGHRHRLEGRTDARPHFRDRGGAQHFVARARHLDGGARRRRDRRASHATAR